MLSESIPIELSSSTFFKVIVEPSCTSTSVLLICNLSKSLFVSIAAEESISCITV